MSLFGSIQMGSNTLRAAQVGMQVVGQNIANASTPGYIREEVLLEPGPTQKKGGLILGLGVAVAGVVQKIDKFVEERLRGAVADRANSETQEQIFRQLEGLVGELGDTDLSTSLNNFFHSINEILNQPESDAVRNLAVLKGETLAGDINRLAKRVNVIRTDVNKRVLAITDDINRLTEDVRALNVRIAETEGGDASASDAVGLRDQRAIALTNLAKLVEIQAVEQPNGTVTVFAGGDFLVFEGVRREVETVLGTDRGLTVAEIHIKSTDAKIETSAGELVGLYTARDEVLGGFVDQLDDFAATLAFEFNKVFSSGQGLTGYDTITSEFAVSDPDAELDDAGLNFTPLNGSFQVQVFNRKTGLTQTTQITVDLNGLDDDATLNDIADQLNAISGVSAAITSTNNLVISSTAADQEIAFADDTSGFLAALGINTFFTGYSSLGLGVSEYISDDPSKFAASRAGVGEDTENAVELTAFLDRPLETKNGETISILYNRMVAETTQGSAVAASVAEGFRVFEAALKGQSLAVSGVSLDEEAVRMITYQRMFQASAKFIATANELLGVLLSI